VASKVSIHVKDGGSRKCHAFSHGQTEANGRSLSARAKCKQSKLGPSGQEQNLRKTE